MKQIIIDKLASVEKEHNIKILFSCESGSRGWEFPSPTAITTYGSYTYGPIVIIFL